MMIVIVQQVLIRMYVKHKVSKGLSYALLQAGVETLKTNTYKKYASHV